MLHKRDMISPAFAGTTAQLIVLGAGRPLDGRAPSALRIVEKDRKVLDWVLHAFQKVSAKAVFVGGYDVQSVIAAFPDMTFALNPRWDETGACGSLLTLSFDEELDRYVSYSDVVFRPDVVHRLAAADGKCVVIAVDCRPQHASVRTSARESVRLSGDRVTGIGAEDSGQLAEFVGIIRIPADFSAALRTLKETGDRDLAKGHLSALVHAFISAGVTVKAVDVHGAWSDLDDDRDLARFVFGTKAETLDRLRDRIKTATIPPQVRFSVREWQTDANRCIRNILADLGAGPYAVRSSAKDEDGFAKSNAGRFNSVLNVSDDPEALHLAIEDVIRSYERDDPEDQVFAQPMIENVAAAGVVLTRTGRLGGPYLTISWTDSGNTDDVTSGRADSQRTTVMHRSMSQIPETVPAALRSVIETVREIESLCDTDALDIEFAFDRAGAVHILQIRPLVIAHSRTGETDSKVAGILTVAEKNLQELMQTPDRQVGRRTIWGVMPDWNPAEIVGIRPGRLAMGLYSYLITDHVWATQRAEYGYRDVRPWPLIRMFAGHAFVDTRASFNSFVPATIEQGVAAEIVDVYLDRLESNPKFHDKVEFDIALTAWSYDIDERIERLAMDAGKPRSRFEALSAALSRITANGIARAAGDLQRSLDFSNMLNRRSPADGIDDALALLELCREKGTLPFAHLARGAFVAMTLFRSAERMGLLTSTRVAQFLQSIGTVGQAFVDDAARTKSGEMSFTEFSTRYGHLRPGTYDVASSCYAENPDRFLRPIVDKASAQAHPGAFEWTPAESEALVGGLNAAGIETDIVTLDRFMRDAIRGRELSKFVFTRALSEALEIIARWGASVGLTREQLSNLAFADIAAAARGERTVAELRKSSETGAEVARLASFIEMPALICSPADIFGFEYPDSEPNFVTDKSVTAVPLALTDDGMLENLTGKIVIVPRADPGFDWIFGHGIAGFVTVYGGANSHMAIRAAEFGLPAAIGIGETRFQALSVAPLLELNCRERRLRAVDRI